MSIVSAMLASAVAGAKLHGRSPRWIIGGGMLLIGAGSAALRAAGRRATSSWPALLPGYAVIGLGVGLVMPTLAASAMGAVPQQRGGMAGGVAHHGPAARLRDRDRGAGHGVRLPRRRTTSATTRCPDPAQAAAGLAAGQAGRLAAHVPATVLHGAAAAGIDAGYLVSAGVGLLGALAVILLVRPAAPRPAPEPASVTVG